MSMWSTTSIRRRWVRCTDAVTGKTLSFSDDHIALVRELTENTTSVILPCGLEYQVEGTYAEMMDALGVKRALDDGAAGVG